MFWNFVLAFVIWFGFIGILYIGCFAPTWEKKDKRGKPKSRSLFMKIVYAIAAPITAIFMIFTAKAVVDDVKEFIKKK
jgi:hypothetical protein